MNKITYTIITIFVGWSLTGCGGSGGSGDKKTIAITIPCQEKSAVESYTALLADDEIRPTSTDSKVEIYHNHLNKKYACLAKGSAEILRGPRGGEHQIVADE